LSKRNTILLLSGFIILLLVVIETGLAADDRVFYGLIGLFVFTQIAWIAYYLRRERQNAFAQKLEQLLPDE
jgi:hypothetical protein